MQNYEEHTNKFCSCCNRELTAVQMDIGYVEFICPVCDNNLCHNCKQNPLSIPKTKFKLELFDPKNEWDCANTHCCECINYYKIIKDGDYRVCFNPEQVDKAISYIFDFCVTNIFKRDKTGRI